MADRPIRWRAAAILVLAALAVDTVVWTLACRRLDDGARDALRDGGWLLDARASHWGGWPIAAAVTFDDASLHTGPDIIPPLAWRAPRLTVALRATAPTQVSVTADGQQALAVGADRPFPFTASTLVATVDLTAAKSPRIDVAGLNVAAPDFQLHVDAAALVLRPDGWSADLAGIVFPATGGRPIDPAIATLHVDGTATPPVRSMPTAEASATDWRDRGGRLALSVPALRWGALAASASGSLSLDDALQPAFIGTVSATGLPQALAQLAANGAVPANSATAAGAMLTILVAPSAGGATTLPVTLERGELAVARFPLLRLAPLRW